VGDKMNNDCILYSGCCLFTRVSRLTTFTFVAGNNAGSLERSGEMANRLTTNNELTSVGR
jgi:hypothetical protein